MIKNFIKALALVLFLSQLLACTNDQSIEVQHTFPGNMWDRFELIELETNIDVLNIDYDLYLHIAHDSSYPFDSLYVNIALYLPSGEIRVNEYTFDMKNKSGVFLSDLIGGKGEQIFLLKEGFKFYEPGIFKVGIECLIPRPEINGVQSIGFILKEVKNNK